jgi:hypothetical protein
MENDSDKGLYDVEQNEKVQTNVSDEIDDVSEEEGKKIVHKIGVYTALPCLLPDPSFPVPSIKVNCNSTPLCLSSAVPRLGHFRNADSRIPN